MGLPSIGEAGWGTILNGQLETDEATLAQTAIAIQNHAANMPAAQPFGGLIDAGGDPHGDRAYANGQISMITTGTNTPPSGFVQLVNGKIPSDLIAGGGIISFYDAVNQFAVPTNGVMDCAPAINTAISTCATNGGGIVWLGVAGVANNTFCLASPIVMQTGVYLWIAPNAILRRIQLTTAPHALITNFTSSTLYPGPFTITGGIWDVWHGCNTTGSVFIFAAAQGVVFRDFQVHAFNDGLSPVGHFYGCTDHLIDNCYFDAGSPPSRNSCTSPCFRVEQCNTANTSPWGIPIGFQNSLGMCTDIKLRHCTNNAPYNTDGQGQYTCWSSFCGTKGTISGSGYYHQFINLFGCAHPGLAIAYVEGYQWYYVNLLDLALAGFAHSLNGPLCPNGYLKTWVGSAPAGGGYWCGSTSNYLP
jgi:hypothetical protein